ncbi:MAG: radical SAM family heme chaperone HemW [Phascolarctobacterium sp.]|nr:radical SAM family heme chaperone HemW [Phascolarctobacterium sp.]
MNFEAVYVHIPFCKQKCLYCDFPSYAGFTCETMKAYVDAVVQEIRLRSFEASKVSQCDTIFFGGGTPSILSANEIKLIVDELKSSGFWKNPREATIEVNPGTADLAKLKDLREMSFNRISFGVQSLSNTELKTIGRIHTSEEALNTINMAREAGFFRINADFIYGLPGQTLKSLESTLEAITQTNIEHLSAYSLILEEGTPLEKLVSSGKLVLPDEDVTADMYDYVQSFLPSQGYKRYEVSNYARSGGESAHNMVYWAYHPYIGFGAAACSFTGKVRLTATSDVQKYIKNIEALRNSTAFGVDAKLQEKSLSSIYNNEELYEVENLSQDELIAEYMFMGLRTVKGANLTEGKARFGVNILQEFSAELEPFFKDNLLAYDEETNYLRLTEAGMAVGNLIFEAFIK